MLSTTLAQVVIALYAADGADVAELSYLHELTVGQVIAALATLGVVVGFFKKVVPLLRRLGNLLDDWNGEPARPGVPERKGVMERLEDQDTVLAKQDEVLRKQDQVLEAMRTSVHPLLVDHEAIGDRHEILRRLHELNALLTDQRDDVVQVKQLLYKHLRESTAWVSAVERATAETGFTTPPWPDMLEPGDAPSGP